MDNILAMILAGGRGKRAGTADFSNKVVPANSTVPAQPVARLFPIFNEREEVLQGVYNSSN